MDNKDVGKSLTIQNPGPVCRNRFLDVGFEAQTPPVHVKCWGTNFYLTEKIGKLKHSSTWSQHPAMRNYKNYSHKTNGTDGSINRITHNHAPTPAKVVIFGKGNRQFEDISSMDLWG